jgi:zinc/manganese transport system substrate-binding protein
LGRQLVGQLAWLALLSGLLAACGGRPTQGPPQKATQPASSRLRVATTVLPITLFTRAVVGDCAEVVSLLPASAGAHDFQARPADGVALQQAQVLVKNGLGLEDFLGKLQASAANPDLVVIDASRNVTPLAGAAEPRVDGDARGHGGDHGDDQDDAHDHGHDHGPVNPHVWLDPLRAAQQVESIRDGLVRADPRCAPTYRRNATAFIARLRQLNRQLADQLAPYRGRTLVAFHDVAPYFAERYGLKADFLVDVPAVNPSPADLQRVARAVKRHQLRALLSEPQQGQRSLNALARDLGIGVKVFDPLEIASEAEARQPDTYFRVMARNGEQVRAVFTGT